jgi:two-component system chemotaxis response regulator CheB
MKKTIKVLVIDDSLIFREGIRRILNEDPALEVVGTAADVFMACQMIETLQPDVLTLDIEMPRMNGIEFLKRLMAQHPLPVIIVSSLSQGAFDAIREGAVDFVIKPAAETGGMASLGQELRLKVKIASMARVGSPARLVPAGPTGLKPQAEEVFFSRVRTMRAVDLIVIGASTGGTEAVSQILSGLASDMPPILIVQHMMPLFTRLFAERLDKVCALTVREAQGRLPLERGQVIIAAGEQHLQVRREGRHLLAVSQPG